MKSSPFLLTFPLLNIWIFFHPGPRISKKTFPDVTNVGKRIISGVRHEEEFR